MVVPIYCLTVAVASLLTFSRGINKAPKTRLFFKALLMVLIILVVSANRKGNDIINYYISYNSNNSLSSEWLYYLLERLGKLLGLNFYQFRALISFAAYILIEKTLSLYCKKSGFVWLFYCFHLIYMDSMQLKNFLAASIFIYSTRYLFDLKQRTNVFKYIACIILEVGMHTAFAISAVLLLLLIHGRKQFVGCLLFIGGSFSIITFLNGNRIPFAYELIQLMLGEDSRVDSYFQTTTNWGFLPPTVLYTLGLAMLLVLDSGLMRQTSIRTLAFTPKAGVLQGGFMKVLIMINVCFVVVIPLAMLNLTFYRFFRNLLYLNFAAAGNAYYNQKLIYKRAIIVLMTSVLCLGWSLFDFQIYSTTEFIIKPVLEGVMFWV